MEIGSQVHYIMILKVKEMREREMYKGKNLMGSKDKSD